MSSISYRSKRVAEVLADVDLMGIGDVVPDLADEYRTEADAIAQRVSALDAPDNVHQIAKVVEEVFRHWFGQQVMPSEAEEIAQRILADGHRG